MLAALAGSDRKAALALVTDLMSIAGTTNVGGRTVAEIADRFLEQSTLKGGALPRDALDTIKRFLAITGDPDEAIAQLRALAADAKLDIAAAIDQFESRVGFMAARGIDTAQDPVFHLVRPRPRLLHRLRVRTASPRATAPSRWWRADAMTG